MGEQDTYDVVATDTPFQGRIISLAVDDVRMSDGSVAKREYIVHPGAVVVVALDDEGRVVLVNQYRHPVRARLDELPAGLLDVPGEPALDAAKRELAEEAQLAAGDWNVLLDLVSSPGCSNEAVRIFLARDLSAVASDFVAEHEELTLRVTREPLADVARHALTGGLTNAAAVAGVLAAVHGRATGWRDLRPADAPWAMHPARVGS